MMEWYTIFILLAIQIWISVSVKLFYVLPDNDTAVSCPSQPCATLSQYLLDNGTLPVASNVEYHFLPGEHRIITNMVLQNLQNFSLIGTVSKPTLVVLVLVDYSQTLTVDIINSYNVTTAHITLKHCRHSQLTNLLVSSCYSCTIENVIFMSIGLIGTNLIGRSYLTEITIKVNEKKSISFCSGITLTYWDQQQPFYYNHCLLMNHINIVGDGNKCNSNYNPIGLNINIYLKIANLTIFLTNSLFYDLTRSALLIVDKCHGKNTIHIENCTFEYNGYYISDDEPQPLINVFISHNYKSVSFKRSRFKSNHFPILLSVLVRASKSTCHGYNKYCIIGPPSSIIFDACYFNNNLIVSELLKIHGVYCKADIRIIGPFYFDNNKLEYGVHRYGNDNNMVTISNMNVSTAGSLVVSSNNAQKIMFFKNCIVLFCDHVLFTPNICAHVIYLQSTFIEVMEYANITLFKNVHDDDLIQVDCSYKHRVYPLCLFQFLHEKHNSCISSTFLHQHY